MPPKSLSFLITYAVVAGASPQPSWSVHTNVDRSTLTIGDLITFSLVIEHPQGTSVVAPSFDGLPDSLVLVNKEQPPSQTIDNRSTSKFVLKLQAQKIGNVRIAEQTVEIKDATGAVLSQKTSAIDIIIQSVLNQKEPPQDVRDIKALEQLPAELPWKLITFIFLGAVAMGIAWIVFRKKRHSERLVVESPHDIAQRELQKLYHEWKQHPELTQIFGFKLSSIIRLYVEQRYGFNATDLTTEEVVAALNKWAAIPPAEQTRLRSLLENTDPIKYAAATATHPLIESLYNDALIFIKATEHPVDRPQPSP